MGKRKGKNRKRVSPAIFVFTGETVNLTLKAVGLFEQPLQRANPLDEKVVFAQKTLQSVKRKLEWMKKSVGVACSNPLVFATMVAMIIATAGVTGLGYLMHVTMTQPLTELAALTQRLRDGQTEVRATVLGQDEMAGAESVSGCWTRWPSRPRNWPLTRRCTSR
jgi:methyl-accepting chemotaxis protein